MSALRKELVDSFGRFHSYLRISLTEKCNLRCQYCMPEHGVQLTSKDHLLTLDERKRVVSIFAELGVNKLRFTGGEPTVSTHLLPLIDYSRSLSQNPMKSIGITSNGILLADQLPKLAKAGLTSVNISLDTLKEAKFGNITRRDGKLINRVHSSIFSAISHQLSTKVNCVVMKGTNDDELADFVHYAMHYNLTVRFIELMPFDGNQWKSSQFMSYFEIIDHLKKEHGLTLIKDPENYQKDKNDTTKWYRIQENPAAGRIGFITSMSNHFCGTCNRLRITADGKLKVCLFGEEGFSFKEAFQKHSKDEDIFSEIHEAILRKKFALGGHQDAVHIATTAKNRPMILIGG